MNDVLNQVLIDKSASGRIRPWKENKMKNHYLALAYDTIDPHKAVRLRNCATLLDFAVGSDGTKKLANANFCRVRLCPMCNWRRSLKVFSQTLSIMRYLESQNYAFIFCTLTVRNCEGQDLSDTITAMMTAWSRFIGYKDIKKAIKGTFRALEITHNLDIKSTSYNTFHPHIHVVFAVNKSYFTSRDYLSKDKIIELWRKAAQLNYNPSVDIRKIKSAQAKAVAEAAKYAVKANDYIILDDWDLSLDTIRILDKALDRRRLVSYTGVFKNAHTALNLDDAEDGDLLHVETEPETSQSDEKHQIYIWNIGYQQYLG